MKLGLGLSLNGFRGGGAAASNLDTLKASSATLAVYDWLTPSTMTAGDAGAVVQGDSDTIANVPNAKTPGTMDLAQAAGARQPIYNNGAIHDGTNDYLAAAFTANTGPANGTLVYVIKSSDTQFMVGGTNSTTYFAGAADSGSGSSAHSSVGTPTYSTGGTGIGSTRGALFTSWGTGSAVVARVEGADYQNASITDIRSSWGTSGFFGNGNFMLVAILDGSDGEYSNALAAAEAFASEIITGLGL